MSRRLRALTCTALAIPLLACSGATDVQALLTGGSDQQVIVPGTPPAPEPGSGDTSSCGDPCGILLEHDFQELRDGAYCDLCGDSDPTACKGEWLTGLSCVQYDWLRNCMYARLGYDFDGSDWREVFDEEPWYRPDPAFSWDNVTAVQVRNAKALQRIVDGRQCSD